MGLGRFCAAAVDALRLDRFHLVVHDIGGPVGFELAAAMPERVTSLTVLNTIVAVDTFKRPWSMEPFARRGVGEAYLRSLSKPAFRVLMRLQGIQIVWGDRDPALKLDVEGEQARVATGLGEIYRVPAKHFLQEDQAPAIADRVAALAAEAAA